MASQSFAQELVNISAAGTLYNTYTTAKSVLNSATATAASTGVITVPANFFQIGARLEIDIDAGVSNRVTGPDTFTVQIMVGNVIAFTTGAIALTTTANTLAPVHGKIILTCRTVGNGTIATLMGSSFWNGQNVGQVAAANNAAGTGNTMAPLTAPAVGTGFDSTIPNTIDLWVAQSVSNAGNGIQIQQYSVKSWGNSSA